MLFKILKMYTLRANCKQEWHKNKTLQYRVMNVITLFRLSSSVSLLLWGKLVALKQNHHMDLKVIIKVC